VAFARAAESAAACSMLTRHVLPGATRPMTIRPSTQVVAVLAWARDQG